LKNDYRTLVPASLHARWGFGEASSLLGELGLLLEKPKALPSSLGQYFFLQATSRLAQGLDLIFTSDYSSEHAFAPDTRAWAFGPGIQYYPFQRVELRIDMLGQKAFGAAASDFTLDLLAQMHWWF
jgi:hypothetical protein